MACCSAGDGESVLTTGPQGTAVLFLTWGGQNGATAESGNYDNYTRFLLVFAEWFCKLSHLKCSLAMFKPLLMVMLESMGSLLGGSCSNRQREVPSSISPSIPSAGGGEPCSRETCSGLCVQRPFKISSIHSLHFSGSSRRELMGGWAAFSPILQGDGGWYIVR